MLGMGMGALASQPQPQAAAPTPAHTTSTTIASTTMCSVLAHHQASNVHVGALGNVAVGIHENAL